MFSLFINRQLYTFAPPPYQTDVIPVPVTVITDWWGDYVGIRLFIWDTWEYTDRFYPGDIVRPAPDCPNLDYIPSTTSGADQYPPYYFTSGGSLVTQGPNWLEGTPGPDSLNMGDSGGPYDGAIAFQSRDSIDDTSADEIIIPGTAEDTTFESNGGADIYVWKLGDGNDSYRPWNTGPGDDIVHILDVASASADINLSGHENRNLQIDMPSGETLTLLNVFTADSGHHIEELRFQDRSYTLDGIRLRAMEEQKASGNVYGTNLQENHIHRPSVDGSYTLRRVENEGGNFDTLTFQGLDLEDVTLEYCCGAYSNLTITTPDGDTVVVERQLSGGPDWSAAHEIYFEDGLATSQELLDKAVDDQIADGGGVNLLPAQDETLRYVTSEDGYIYFESWDNGSSETDRIFFTEDGLADVTFESAYNDLNIRTSDGDLVSMRDHFDFDQDMEEIWFAGESSPMSYADQLARLHADQLAAGGTVWMTRQDDVITYDAAAHGTISFDHFRAVSGDTDVFQTSTPHTSVRMGTGDREFLYFEFPDGDRVNMGGGVQNDSRRFETFTFNGVTRTLSEIQEQAFENDLANGSTVWLTYGDDRVDYSVSAHGDGYINTSWDRNGDTDTIAVDEPYSDVSLSMNGNDLEITTSDGDTLRIRDAFGRADSGQAIQVFEFDGTIIPTNTVETDAGP